MGCWGSYNPTCRGILTPSLAGWISHLSHSLTQNFRKRTLFKRKRKAESSSCIKPLAPWKKKLTQKNLQNETMAPEMTTVTICCVYVCVFIIHMYET